MMMHGYNASHLIKNEEDCGFGLKIQYNSPMSKKEISDGVVHKMPADLRKFLSADKAALAKWEDITPRARNEWICWV